MSQEHDDNVLTAEANDINYRKDCLCACQEEIDLEDLKTGISISDLGQTILELISLAI